MVAKPKGLPEIRFAPSKRAMCRLCSLPIAEGDVSLSYVYDVFNNNRVNKASVHWRCFLKAHEEIFGAGIEKMRG
jgi:hypothetical protein